MTSKIGRDVDGAATAYHENWGIIMSGGLGAQTYYADNVTLTTNGEDFTELPTPVPEEYSGYCVAAIDENRVAIQLQNIFAQKSLENPFESTILYKYT